MNYLRDCDSVVAREGPQECTKEYDSGQFDNSFEKLVAFVMWTSLVKLIVSIVSLYF